MLWYYSGRVRRSTAVSALYLRNNKGKGTQNGQKPENISGRYAYMYGLYNLGDANTKGLKGIT